MQKIKNYLRWLFSSKKASPELVKWVDQIFEDAKKDIMEASSVYWKSYNNQFENKN